MRFLMLGYSPYLPMILDALAGTDFLKQNELDIVLAQPPSQKLMQTAIDDFKANLDEPQLAHFSHTVARGQAVSSQLFPEINLKLLTSYPNIIFRDYNKGLAHLDNLTIYDFMIVSSYAYKIPRAIFDQPKRGTLNIHASCLPSLRGGYPTYIQAFDPTQPRGTTIHVMSDEWDDGEIVAQKRAELDTALKNEELLSLSAQHAAQLLNQLHQQAFHFEKIPQNLGQVSYCHKLMKRQHYLQEMPNAEAFEGFVRANCDRYLYPFTFTFYENQLFIILDVAPVPVDFVPSHDFSNKQIVKIADRYYLRFDQRIYQITKGIFQGFYVEQVPARSQSYYPVDRVVF